MKKVYIVGSINKDIIFKLNRFPNEGETMPAQKYFTLPGGKGANQAVACSHFGVPTELIASVGDDVFGEESIQGLITAKVNVDHVTIKKNTTTGIACILINNGDNRIILNEGANDMTSPLDAIDVLDRAKDNEVLLAQFEVPVPTVVESIQKAKEKHFFTILNPAPAKTIPEDIYPSIDLIIPNEIEAQMITGYSLHDPDFDQKVIHYFISKGVKEVVMTKGANGSVYANRHEIYPLKAFKVQVVDSTGAGDTFVGAIASEIAKGKTVKEALVFASAASAITISRLGAQSSIPHLEDVNLFLQRKNGDLHETDD